jgi:hypothetical protein
MKNQILAFFLCTLIATSVCGITYAQWNDVIEIRSTMRFGTLTLRFVDPLDCSDNDDSTKDSGECLCEYTNPDSGGFETLEVSIAKAYPGYEACCTFTLENVGTLPDHVRGIKMIPGAGLKVGETYVDAGGNAIGWQLDDDITDETVLIVYVYKDVDSSLVSNTVEPGDQLLGKMIVQAEDGAEQCHTYGFGVEITYE